MPRKGHPPTPESAAYINQLFAEHRPGKRGGDVPDDAARRRRAIRRMAELAAEERQLRAETEWLDTDDDPEVRPELPAGAGNGRPFGPETW